MSIITRGRCGALRPDGAAVVDAVSVRIGSSSFPFTTRAKVSEAYRAAIAHFRAGCSETPACLLLDEAGETVGHVSYNGRIWLGDPRDWRPGQGPVWDP